MYNDTQACLNNGVLNLKYESYIELRRKKSYTYKSRGVTVAPVSLIIFV